jgi:hypothetical protein
LNIFLKYVFSGGDSKGEPSLLSARDDPLKNNARILDQQERRANFFAIKRPVRALIEKKVGWLGQKRERQF